MHLVLMIQKKQYYVLEQDIEKALLANAENLGETNPKIQPLDIRSNIGECVEIKFINYFVKEKASIHPIGLG